ncbi:hypothetical protein [Chitinophaga niabensis]|uniref:Uncharacterized protein n=1 Tax=Chitinophaga niabensis TaxID=536979 RepID=A0A1N6E4S5_9BACT|nr:hypothetical protein [Chitinophaga niabensis]SIN78014.1 hypothetical protein SAMN04488055_1302 [Chitinophaga niabensis]
MKDFRKDFDAALVRMWGKLEKKGYQPIKYQFQRLMGKEKGDLLSNIRSAWKEYAADANNFNNDGTLKNKSNLFPTFLCVPLQGREKEEVLDSLDFTLDYTPEKGLCITNMYMMRTYKNLDHIEINIKHKPDDPPAVKDLKKLMDKTDKQRIRATGGSIIKEVDLTRARKVSMRT